MSLINILIFNGLNFESSDMSFTNDPAVDLHIFLCV